MRRKRGDMSHLDVSEPTARWGWTRGRRARVLLVAINYDGYYSLPIRILALAAATDEVLAKRFDVRYMEWGLAEGLDDYVRRIEKFKADIVGMSVNVWNRDKVFDLAARLKERSPAPCIVAGGQEVTNSVTDYLADVGALDYVIDGEGEVSFKSFLEYWDPGSRRLGDVSGVPGLCYRKDGAVARTPKAEPLASLDDFPSVALAGLVPVKKTVALGVLIESTRGCPFRCSFCYEAARKGKPASMSLDRLGREIDHMTGRGAQSFHMMDPILCNSDPERVRLVSRILEEAEKRHGRPIRISVEAYGDQISPEIAEHLGKRATVDIGLQSTNPDTIKAIHRPFTRDRFCRGVRHLRGAGAAVNIYLITGLPYETFVTAARGIRFALEQRPTRLFQNELSLLNGTELRRRAEEYGYDFDLTPPYLARSSKWMSSFEMNVLNRLGKDIERRHNLSFSARPLSRPVVPCSEALTGGRLRVGVAGGCAWGCAGCARADRGGPGKLPPPDSKYGEAAGMDIELFAGDGVAATELLHHAAQFQLSGAERIRLIGPPSLFGDAELTPRMVGVGIWQYRTFVDFDGDSCGQAVLDLRQALDNVKVCGRSVPLRGRGDLRPYVEVVALLRGDNLDAFRDAAEHIRNEVEAIHMPGLAGSGPSLPAEDLRAMVLDAVESSEEVERMNKTYRRFRTAGRDYWPKLPGPVMKGVLSESDYVDEIVEHLCELELLTDETVSPPCLVAE